MKCNDEKKPYEIPLFVMILPDEGDIVTISQCTEEEQWGPLL